MWPVQCCYDFSTPKPLPLLHAPCCQFSLAPAPLPLFVLTCLYNFVDESPAADTPSSVGISLLLSNFVDLFIYPFQTLPLLAVAYCRVAPRSRTPCWQ